MILMDVAAGPIFAVLGVTFLLAFLAVAGIVFLAVKLIKKAMKK